MRSRVAPATVSMFAVCLLFLGSNASADQITFVSGIIDYSRQNQAEVSITLNDSGWMRANFGDNSNESWNPDHICYGCTPGGTITPSVTESFGDNPNPDVGVGGGFIYRGLRYDLEALTFTIDAGDLLIPQQLDFAITSATRFVLRGMMTGVHDGSVVAFSIFGVGNARVAFEGGNWFDTSYTFDDPSAVPEPGSLLLFGTGAAALAARWRKRRALASL